MMSNLVFIRHSQTRLEAGIPSKEWRLTDEGRRRCRVLAEALVPYQLHQIVTSRELKAIETGAMVAEQLGIQCQAADNLHEHERESAPYFVSQEEFLEAVAALFARPDELVFGEETGLAARERFSSAVQAIMTENPRENIAIVTHGTVLSLFVNRVTGCEIYPFWLKLGMPAIVAFSYPEMVLLAQVNEIV